MPSYLRCSEEGGEKAFVEPPSFIPSSLIVVEFLLNENSLFGLQASLWQEDK
jgi:hypothetical protein